ncbi:2'-5'-oligoadenylate synthase 3-like [Dendronephthya gigantea]|uniref:2'-5'-oligoadenylate synthase 3-like n=1 Tax=Dendronephthya gigantea TaxID=151771 RepID=UPI00106D9304|nr:2'-5'-oligoadenylate synthase 3-like [Dendronephthya gigantea]
MSAPSLTKLLQNEDPPNVTLAKAAELSPIFLKNCNHVIDQICEHIEENFPASVGKIKNFIQGGSLGNGTAVYGRDDVDSVVVVCFDYDTTDVKELLKKHKAKSRKIMDTIEERLVNMVSFDLEVDEVTDSGIACTVTIPSGPLDLSVYVMATFYVDVKKSAIRNEVYDQLGKASSEEVEMLGSALSQLQVDFVKDMDQQLKCLMKLVKFWVQKGFVEKENQNLPSPYLLELVTIFCWQHASSPETFKFASAFRAILLTLRDHKSLKAVWDINYRWDRAQDVVHLERPPIVVDPANPTVNLCRDCNAWDEVARGADQTLKTPLLRSLSSPKSVWS